MSRAVRRRGASPARGAHSVAKLPWWHLTLRRIRNWLLALAALGLLVADLPVGGQTRELRRIERPKRREAGPLYSGPALPLPTREACEQAARGIAADYEPGGALDPWLAQDFDYREEVLDALERVAPYATRIRLEVESVESVKIEPWRVDLERSTPQRQRLVSECVADVRTRLTFDDPATGQRTVRPVGRAQWFLRTQAEVVR